MKFYTETAQINNLYLLYIMRFIIIIVTFHNIYDLNVLCNSKCYMSLTSIYKQIKVNLQNLCNIFSCKNIKILSN